MLGNVRGQKRTCGVQLGMSAKGQKRTSLWQQLVRKTLHAAGHRYLDTGEIAPGQAWLRCDHLGPNNEKGRDHDEDNGQLLAYCGRFHLYAGSLGPNAFGRSDRAYIGSKIQKLC